MLISHMNYVDLGSASDQVTKQFLGSNILFQNDSVEETGSFSTIIEHIGISLVRYPGGTVSEEYFDPSDPTSTYQQNAVDIISGASTIRTQDVMGLDTFLEYSAEEGKQVSIVLPTYRYFDPTSGALVASAEAEVRGFIRGLLNGNFGTIDHITLELGNEYYQNRFDWTAAQFAQAQAQIASWVHQEATAIGHRDDIDILAQTGRSMAEHDLFASHFSGNDAETIDGVLTHLYGTNSSGNALNIGGGIGNRLEDINTVWGQALGDDFVLAVTEWNVGENGPDDTLINGQMRIAPLLRIYTEMLRNDVDVATIWSTITNGPAGLAQTVSGTAQLSTTGYLYSMLVQNTTGLSLIETGENQKIVDQSGEEIGYTYLFGNESRYVIYISSGHSEEISFTSDISGLFQEGAYIYASFLSAADGTTGTEYWATSQLDYLTDIQVTQNGSGDYDLLFEIDPYQLVELHVVFSGGIAIEGDTQNNISDELVGSAFDDTLSGNLGNDWIDGNAGNDVLSGGEGHDTVTGGAGDDILYGQHGKDFLNGGIGNDYLDGGFWHDTLVAGSGQDTLLGGAGNDRFIVGLGDATIAGGDGNDILSFEDAVSGIAAFTAPGSVEIGANTAEYTDIEIIQGSTYADYFQIVVSGMTISGGAGADTFNLYDGSFNIVQGGDGNDSFFVYSIGENEVNGDGGSDDFLLLAGDNTISLGTGNDVARTFNPMSDTFLFESGDGSDEIFGFDMDHDRLVFAPGSSEILNLSETVSGTIISYGDDDSIILHGVFDITAESDIFL